MCLCRVANETRPSEGDIELRGSCVVRKSPSLRATRQELRRQSTKCKKASVAATCALSLTDQSFVLKGPQSCQLSTPIIIISEVPNIATPQFIPSLCLGLAWKDLLWDSSLTTLCQLLVSSENDVMILHVQLDGSGQGVFERTERNLDGSGQGIFERTERTLDGSGQVIFERTVRQLDGPCHFWTYWTSICLIFIQSVNHQTTSRQTDRQTDAAPQ